MSEYIKKEYLLSALNVFRDEEDRNPYFFKGIEIAKEIIENAPDEDVAPVVHGWWIEYIPVTQNAYSQFRCSNCGWWAFDPSVDGVYHYCPKCGAKKDVVFDNA